MKQRATSELALALTISALLALSVTTAGCAAERDRREERTVRQLIADTRYAEALQLATKRREEAPADAARENEWKLAQVAWLLEQGRRATFAGRDTEALEFFEQAKAVGLEIRQIGPWISATREKLAQRFAEVGQEWHAQDNLERAIEAYEQSLGYLPTHQFAKEGLSRALLQQNFRAGMSQDYYEDGVHALDAYWLQEASHDFEASLKYRDSHERADQRNAQTKALLADERVLLAQKLEAEEQWAAARSEYRVATLIDDKHAIARDGLARMRTESKAADHLRDAERFTLRGDFERAQKAIDEGRALTQRQHTRFDIASEQLAHAKLERVYARARSLENDYRYEDAIAVYDELIRETRGFEDAIARKETLVDFVAKAVEYYAAAEAAESLEDRASALRQVLIVYPEFKDARERLAAVEAELAAPKEDGTPR